MTPPLYTLASLLPLLTEASIPVGPACDGWTDPFERHDCQANHAKRTAILARELPKLRVHATGTLRARPFDFARGTYILDLAELDGAGTPSALERADLYLSTFLPRRRSSVFPAVHSGTLACKRARVDELQGVYDTLVLDAWTVESAKLATEDARESPLRDADVPVELIGHLVQTPVTICCGPTTTTMVKNAYAGCSYAPFRFVVDEARAEGLPTRGFATEPTPTDAPVEAWLEAPLTPRTPPQQTTR